MMYIVPWLIVMILLESFALYSVKIYSINHNMKHILISSILYALIPITLYQIIKMGHGLAITNIVWNITSILYGLFIGVILFGEYISIQQKIGAIMGIIGISIILWHTDN